MFDALLPPCTAVDFDPFAGGDLTRAMPTIAAQREIWAAMALEPEAAAAYNDTAALTLDGTLDRAALHGALQALVARHDALRAGITADGETLFVFARLAQPLAEVDLSGLGAEAQAARLRALEEDHVTRHPDLASPPPLRATLVRLHPGRHVLLLTISHILCDGLSWGVLFHDLAALYALAVGQGEALPPPVSFLDYAAYALAAETDEALAPHLAHWQSVLGDGGPEWSLPLDFPAPERRAFAAGRYEAMIEPALIGALKTAARGQGMTFHTLMTAAVALLLHRLAGAEEVITGINVGGQLATGHAAMIGHAVHLLPLRTRLDPGVPFADWARRVGGDLIEAREHQSVDFGTLLRHLPVRRPLGRVPLMPVIFNIDPPDDGVRFPSLNASLRVVPRRCEAFELFFDSVERGGGLLLQWYYGRRLFSEATIPRFAQAFECLLRGIAADPLTPAAALPLMDAATRRAVVEDWNALTLTPPAETVLGLVAAQALASPNAVAVSDPAGEMTYAGLMARIEAIAAAVLAAGAGPGRTVGVLLERSRDSVAALLGVMRAGAVYVPLDPAHPDERLAVIAEDAALAVVLHDAASRPGRPMGGAALLDIATITDGPGDSLPPLPSGEALAYQIYTSGSTGKPKGVPIPHGALASFLLAMKDVLRAGPGMRLLAQTTVSFDVSFLELLLPLVSGGRVMVAPQAMVVDAAALAEHARAMDTTHWQATPQSWRMLLAVGWQGLPGLIALSCGEALPRDVAAGLLERCAALWNLYGPTEATVYVTADRVTDAADITVGRPLANCRVYVVDGQGQPVPPGVVGEIVIGGRCVAPGYHQRPEMTAAAFVPDTLAPSEAGGLLYRTGDLGVMGADGRLRHLGRRDGQIKLRGHRIELEEIEACLLALPLGLAEAAVSLLAPGSAEARLVATLVPRSDAGRLEEGAIRTALGARLPAYMVPAVFRWADRLPRTGSGKLDRKAVAATLEAAPARVDAAPPPEDSLEGRVIALWRDLLPVERIGPEDHFFEIGGHSLLAARLFGELNRRFHTTLGLGELLRHDTPRALADLVGRSRKVEAVHAVRLAEGSARVAPLFLFPPQGGQVLRYGPLIQALDPGLPVWAFQQDERLLDLTSVEATAALFVAELQALQPEGPVRVGGYSFGGILAFEAAHQLRAAGREVEWVILLDALNWPRETVTFKLRRAFYEGLFAADRKKWLRDKVSRNLRRLIGVYEDVPLYDAELLGSPAYETLFWVHHAALNAYSPRPYDGRVVLFRVVGDPIMTALLPDNGWKGVLVGESEEVGLPVASHSELLTPEAVPALARHLAARLLPAG